MYVFDKTIPNTSSRYNSTNKNNLAAYIKSGGVTNTTDTLTDTSTVTHTFLKEVLQTRMTAATPALTDTNKLVTPTLSAQSIADYLDPVTAIAPTTTPTISWTNAATGGIWTQRVGINNFYRFTPVGGTPNVIGPSRSSDSFKTKKTTAAGTYTISRSLYPFSIGTTVSSTKVVNGIYRNIWLRGYDERHRLIQASYSFEYSGP